MKEGLILEVENGFFAEIEPCMKPGEKKTANCKIAGFAALCALLFFTTTLANAQSKKIKNILFICVDDLRPELRSFGKSYIISPNIDQLAAAGRAFTNQYVNAPSCGPSRCALLTGCYGPYGNDALFERAKTVVKEPRKVNATMPEWFKNNGYTTVAVGKVSHHPGGWGGEDWNDSTVVEMPNAWHRSLMPTGQWQHPRGAMHGLAHGQIRADPSKMDVYESAPGPDSIYPDGLIVNEAINQLDLLASEKEKPFFLMVGLLKPHLPFGAPQKYLDLYKNVQLPPIPAPLKPAGISTWFNSGEFMGYNRWGRDPRNDAAFATDVRLHYAACVSYADAQVGRILKKLKEKGADKNTIIVLWGDHGWNLGEHNIWGKHNLFDVALRSPLIISYPGLKQPGKNAEGVVETVDIFPTLCDLTKVVKPGFIHGVSLMPMLNNSNAAGHAAIAYIANANTLVTQTHRLIEHKNGGVELYDHRSDKNETLNIADRYPEIVNEMKKILDKRIALRKVYD